MDLQLARDELQNARDECLLVINMFSLNLIRFFVFDVFFFNKQWKNTIIHALDPNLEVSSLNVTDVADQFESIGAGLRNLRSEFEHQQVHLLFVESFKLCHF